MLIQSNGQVIEPFLVLARKYGIDAPPGIDPQALSDRLQQHWRRKTEHQYQIRGGPPDNEDLSLLCDCNAVLEPTAPPWVRAKGSVILGGTPVAARRRLRYLQQTYEQGQDIGETVYLLGGVNTLYNNDEERRQVLCTPGDLAFKEGWTPPDSLPTTEIGMAELVWHQSVLPSAWHHQVVRAELQPKNANDPDGEKRSPNTDDTIRAWLASNPPPGDYWLVSSQPYVTRQQMDADLVIPENCGIHASAIGPAVVTSPITTPLKTFLDAMASQLYTELKWRHVFGKKQ